MKTIILQLELERDAAAMRVQKLNTTIETLKQLNGAVTQRRARLAKPAQKAAFINTAPKAKPRPVLSAQGRRNIVAAQKKRWAAVKAVKK